LAQEIARDVERAALLSSQKRSAEREEGDPRLRGTAGIPGISRDFPVVADDLNGASA